MRPNRLVVPVAGVETHSESAAKNQRPKQNVDLQWKFKLQIKVNVGVSAQGDIEEAITAASEAYGSMDQTEK